MKKALCILPLVILFGFCFLICASAEDGRAEYYVFCEGDEYILAEGASASSHMLRSYSIKDIFAYTDNISGEKRINFLDVTADERIDIFSDGYILCGSLTLPFGMNISGEVTLFCDIVSLCEPIVVNGTLTVCDGRIDAFARRGAIRVVDGELFILGGEIINTDGDAVYSSGELTLSGEPRLIGNKYSVSTDVPISLSYNSDPFTAPLSVLYRGEFISGESKQIFKSATEYNTKNVKLYDFYGREYGWRLITDEGVEAPLQYGAVYLPYNVKYFHNGELVGYEECLSGEVADGIEAPEILGYSFLGWYKSGLSAVEVSELPVFSDTALYAKYALSAPRVSLREERFDESGALTRLYAVLSHPLLDEGDISYSWMRDGEVVHSGCEYIDLGASERGSYTCTVKLSVRGDTVSVSTGAFTLDALAQGVELNTGIIIPFLSVSFILFLVLLYFAIDKPVLVRQKQKVKF
jgi:hypothetical protein